MAGHMGVKTGGARPSAGKQHPSSKARPGRGVRSLTPLGSGRGVTARVPQGRQNTRFHVRKLLRRQDTREGTSGALVGTVTVDHDHHQGGMTKLRSSWEAKLAGLKGKGAYTISFRSEQQGDGCSVLQGGLIGKGSNGWSVRSIPEERGRQACQCQPRRWRGITAVGRREGRRDRRLTDGAGEDAGSGCRHGCQRGTDAARGHLQDGAPRPPHGLTDDGFSSWLVTDSERYITGTAPRPTSRGPECRRDWG